MNPQRSFRVVAYLEGVSLLLLVLVAMPLKYGMGEPIAVKILGPLHGLFFLAYLAVLQSAALAFEWPRRTIFLALAASILPGGTLVLDRWLQRTKSIPT